MRFISQVEKDKGYVSAQISLNSRPTNWCLPFQLPRQWSAVSGLAAFSLSLFVSTSVPAFAQQADTVVLRGSEGAVVEVADPANASLRGGIVQQEIIDPVQSTPIADVQQRGFLPGFGASAAYLRDNTIPELFFRGSNSVVTERDVTYSMPEYGSLRHSMMHQANAYEGLRGASAGVGDTVAAALRGSYSTRARLERANVDRARAHGAFAAFLPKVNGTLQAGRSFSESNYSSTANGTAVTAGVEVSMPLYTSGTNLNNYRRAQHVSKASDYNFIAEEHRVALEAIGAHINLRLSRRIENTLQGNVKAMQRIAKIARSLFQAGETSRTDIAIADANVESAKAELDLARKSREEVLADYESLTGKYAPKKLNVGKIDRIVPQTLRQAVDMAMQFNPTLVAATHTAMAGTYGARAERGRYGPQVNLYGSYERDLYASYDTGRTEDWSVGVRLTMPIFDMTAAPNIAAARHEALESGYRALDQGRRVEQQVERQWVAYKSAARRTKIVRRQVQALKASVTGTRKEFEAGYRSITDVLTDQIKLARARITLENARHERMYTAYQLVFTTADPALKNLPGVQYFASSR